MPRRPGQHRRELLAAAGAQGDAAEQAERHVAAQLRGEPGRSSRAARVPHSASSATSAAAASALPPARPAAAGMDLAIADRGVGRHPGVRGQQLGGPPDEVAAVRRDDVAAGRARSPRR